MMKKLILGAIAIGAVALGAVAMARSFQEDEVIRRSCAEVWDGGNNADDPAAMADCYKTWKELSGPFKVWTCIGDCDPA